MENNFDISKLQKEVKEALFHLPRAIGVKAVEIFKENFRLQGFMDSSVNKWKSRKNNKRSEGRAILVKSGRLKRSIRIINTTQESATIGTDVEYAQVHNEGSNDTVNVKSHERKTSGKSFVYNIKSKRRSTVKVQTGTAQVKSHSRRLNIPQRQFIGNSQHLERSIVILIEKKLQQLFK